MESAEAMHGCIHLVHSFSTPTGCSEDEGFDFTVEALSTLVPRTSENRPENAGRAPFNCIILLVCSPALD